MLEMCDEFVVCRTIDGQPYIPFADVMTAEEVLESPRFAGCSLICYSGYCNAILIPEQFVTQID